MNMPRRLPLLALALALALAGCGSHTNESSERAPLAGAKIGGPFMLTDQNGRTVTDRDFAGRYRIMYFGYTFCPDVCPVDMQHLGAAMRLIEASDPKLAARLAPIFVSIDPARDTPAVLKTFVTAFSPRLIGLTGSAQAIAAVAKEYGVYFAKGEPSAGGGYMVNHSRVTYLMDPSGHPLALLPTDQDPKAVVAEIERWAR